ncbi:hypothetical protein ACF06X_33630 [Streptomyces sp. NPDC015346]|uniref:hypothetical protein n=1 Tax=Streptomyces sp. NPDC015346 TaxID=3364954 RepID=UPI0036F86C8C
MPAITLPPAAVVGRRVELAYYRDQDTYLPGIITTITDDPASLRVRLDGLRSTVACRADYEGLRYLDDVTPVPELPMGRFHPTVSDFDGATYAGIPVCQFEDEDIVLLTADPAAARAALLAYFQDQGMDPDSGFHDPDGVELRWVVFEWQPEDAECPWLMTFDVEGADMAIQIHYLPA